MPQSNISMFVGANLRKGAFMNLKNKLLIILFIFITLTFFLFSSVFAADVIIEDDTITLSEFYDNKYVFIGYDGHNRQVIYSDYPFSFTSDDMSSFLFTPSSNCPNIATALVPYNGILTSPSDDDFTIYSTPVTIMLGSYLTNSDCKVLYTNFNIYCNDEVVFQGAPLTQVTIPAIQQVEEIPQVMEQVLKILIPIGLIVLSIGLVIYLTRLVISRVQ